ncbi:putative D-arabinono-1,4-lactone oxidase [Zalerion maritima]|uniref:D-arabinono-1,4-lactone oxidase n=1 Tax=Zalerion maritima TaxID=339359 RepID=A0AAD5WX49_9PEZI|nr:putative D-arabinono-1,4-lactone oxidase [Zalerion maritima]
MASTTLAVLAAAADDIPFRARTSYSHSTWAKTFSSFPELYIQPESVPEVQKIIRLAACARRRIVAAGSAHSPSDLTCTSSWLVNLDNLNKIVSVDHETGVVKAEAGIRLYELSEELDKNGLALASLGSINEQSVAGVISTGTHGSSLRHGLMSDMITSLKIALADGTVRSCSKLEEPDLFRAALLSLGALGIIVEVTVQAVPSFALAWSQTIDTDVDMLSRWPSSLWTTDEFVRVWWFPYTRRAVVWSASKTYEPQYDPPTSYYDGTLGYYVYHNLLLLAQAVPRILPWVEWFVFGMQYGFENPSTITGCQPSRKALLMNCLYKQYVNEWAIPLAKGPEALLRLGSWLNQLKPGDPQYVEHGIPFSARGLWVHAPVEVRASYTGTRDSGENRPFLDPSVRDGPTLYLNATLYRPYLYDPPCKERYYEAFEWLMRDLGGKPHWAKNFETTGEEIGQLFRRDDARDEGLGRWRTIRNDVDPKGMFVGPWHRRTVLDGPPLDLEEVEVAREKGPQGGLLVIGTVSG